MKKHYIRIILFATLVAIFVRLFIFETYKVTSNSMSPNLLKGDIVLVLNCAFNLKVPFTNIEIAAWKKPKRSEVVVFTLEKNPWKNFIKRIFAIEGDFVEAKNGSLFVNNNEDKYLRNIALETSTKVPQGHFFVMGDNLSSSIDSRVWGVIPNSLLKGKVLMVLFSTDENGKIRKDRIGKIVN